jgi:hypothetical protein
MMKAWIIINVALTIVLGAWTSCHAPRLATFTLIKITTDNAGMVASMVTYQQEVSDG